jgi:formyl-CoA transferase/CoA:oxalate CoA-transferase
MPPLDGIRVIDLTEALAGPWCTMLLGDLGADVVKVERPDGGDQSRGWGPPFVGSESAYFLATNRNKRGITVNIQTPGGQEVMQRLLAEADVFVTNVRRVESLRKVGLDDETLLALNPRLIICAISGYGRSGPYAGKAGYDLVAQGEAGLMSVTGTTETGPIRFPVPIADMTTGVYSALGILAALLVRERTGKGQVLDMSLLESQASWLSIIAGSTFATGQRPQPVGNAHANIVPYQVFRARDKHFIVAVGSERQWTRFCEVLGIADTVGADPCYATNRDRLAHRAELVGQLQALFEEQDAAHWVAQFETADIPAGPINFVDETLDAPHLLERGFIVALEHPVGSVKSVANPIHLSATPVTYRRAPPLLGQHTAEVLAGVGYADKEIARLREAGAI